MRSGETRPKSIRALTILAMIVYAVMFAVPASAMPHVVFLIRHAERISTTDPDSPLSAAGLKRAELIAKMFGESGVSAIYVTEYVRTQQTAKPLADKLGLPMTKVKAAEIEQLVDRLRQSSDRIALVVSHSRSLPLLVDALGAGKIPDVAETDYSHIYMLVFAGLPKPALVTLVFGETTVSTVGHVSLQRPDQGLLGRRVSVAPRLSRQGASDVALPYAGRPKNDKILVVLDSLRILRQTANDTPLCANIDETLTAAIIPEQCGKEKHRERSQEYCSFCSQFFGCTSTGKGATAHLYRWREEADFRADRPCAC